MAQCSRLTRLSSAFERAITVSLQSVYRVNQTACPPHPAVVALIGTADSISANTASSRVGERINGMRPWLQRLLSSARGVSHVTITVSTTQPIDHSPSPPPHRGRESTDHFSRLVAQNWPSLKTFRRDTIDDIVVKTFKTVILRTTFQALIKTFLFCFFLRKRVLKYFQIFSSIASNNYDRHPVVG